MSILATGWDDRLASTAWPRGGSSFRQGDDRVGSYRAHDGSEVTWRTDDGASPCVRIVVAPVRPGHSFTVDVRTDGGPISEIVATPEWRAPTSGDRVFSARLRQPLTGALELMPVLRFAGQPISPRLGETPAPPPSAPAASPVWDWSSPFLASFSATVRRQDVGETPDGLRIDWLIDGGRVLGPQIDGVVLPGAADFMRIRRDGVAIVDVRGCIETTAGARIFIAYGGALDLGPDGYRRALQGQFAALPPLVVTPTFETADPRLLWLNRVRCFGVGRVDTQALSYGFDIYAVEAGRRRSDSERVERFQQAR